MKTIYEFLVNKKIKPTSEPIEHHVQLLVDLLCNHIIGTDYARDKFYADKEDQNNFILLAHKYDFENNIVQLWGDKRIYKSGKSLSRAEKENLLEIRFGKDSYIRLILTYPGTYRPKQLMWQSENWKHAKVAGVEISKDVKEALEQL